jgi:subtilisin family serine protease
MIPQSAMNAPPPAYHEGLLLVKARPSIAPLGPMAAMAAPAALATPGLSALATLERAGLIKEVIPLAEPYEGAAPAFGMRPALAAMAAGVERDSTADPNAGVSLIRVDPNQDLADLQLVLASDLHIEAVSRVPVRYLLADARPPRRGRAGGATIAAQPPPASTMWNLAKVRWAEARGSAGFKDADLVKVAVLDTGVDAAHPDLQGRVKGYVYEHPDLPLPSGPKDIIGHGTHVSGTIAARINNAVGINGICACDLRVWKIFDDQADYDRYENKFVYYVHPVMYRRALAQCLQQRVNVINLSIGGPGEPDFQERQLFNALLANGTTVVAAMGNGRQFGSPKEYPGAIPGVIAVGATDMADRVSYFSTRGNHIALCAPGEAIWSTLPTYPGQTEFAAVIGPSGKPIEGKALKRETDYAAWQGTSMATPHVAGAVALLLANRGSMAPVAVKQRLQQRADPVIGMQGQPFHPDYGRGRLNLLRLLSSP